MLVTESLTQQQGKRRRIKKKIAKISEANKESDENVAEVTEMNDTLELNVNSEKKKAGRG